MMKSVALAASLVLAATLSPARSAADEETTAGRRGVYRAEPSGRVVSTDEGTTQTTATDTMTSPGAPDVVMPAVPGSAAVASRPAARAVR